MFEVGQRVLLPGGKAVGILVGHVKSDKKGSLECIVNPDECNSDVLPIWHVELEGYFFSKSNSQSNSIPSQTQSQQSPSSPQPPPTNSALPQFPEKEKPYVVQVPEVQLQPVIDIDPFVTVGYNIAYNKCPLCACDFFQDTMKIDNIDADPFDDVIKRFKSDNPDFLTRNEEAASSEDDDDMNIDILKPLRDPSSANANGNKKRSSDAGKLNKSLSNSDLKVKISSDELKNIPIRHPFFPFRICTKCNDKLVHKRWYPANTCCCCGVDNPSKVEDDHLDGRDNETMGIINSDGIIELDLGLDFANDPEISFLKCSTCELNFCPHCCLGIGHLQGKTRRHISVFDVKQMKCVNCFFKESTKNKLQTMNEAAKRQQEKDLHVHEKRINFLLQLELGEKIFTEYDLGNPEESKRLYELFKQNDNLIDFSHVAFKNETYFSTPDKSLTLLEKNLHNKIKPKNDVIYQNKSSGAESDIESDEEDQMRDDKVNASLYIENYFQELHQKNKESGGNGVKFEVENAQPIFVKFYSEYLEKYSEFEYIFKSVYPLEDQTKLKEFTRIVVENVKNKDFRLVPSNLSLSVKKTTKMMVILEGRNGEYVTYNRRDINSHKEGAGICELLGTLKISKFDSPENHKNKYIVDKKVYLDPKRELYIDFNKKGNISHFLRYSMNEDECNLRFQVFVANDDNSVSISESSKIDMKVLLETSNKPISRFSPLVVYAPYGHG